MLDKTFRKAIKSYSMSMGTFFGRIFSPNQMTFLTLLLGICSGVLLAYGFFLESAIVLLFSGFTDLLDGAIAKATGRVSDFGGALDSITDKITELAVYVAFMIYEPVLALPSMMASSMMMWSSYNNERCRTIGFKSGVGFLQRKERMFLILIALFILEFPQLITGWDSQFVVSTILYVIAFFSFLTGVQRVYLTKKLKDKDTQD